MPSKNIYYKGVYENKPKEIIISQPTTIINLIDSNHYTLNLQSNTNLTLTNPTTSKYTFTINNTSNYQITWDTAIKWEGGFPPTTSNTNDIILIDYDGTDYYGCVLDDIRSTLLLDVYPGAAAAYSLRALSASNIDQPVVGVRRSSDDAEQDFTAAELADGTMEAWVNEEVVIYTSNFTSGNEDLNELNGTGTDGETIGGVSDAYKYTLSGGNTSNHLTGVYFLQAGVGYTISFDYYIPSTNSKVDGIRVRNLVANTDFNVLDSWQSETVTTTSSPSNDLFFQPLDGTITTIDADGDVFYLKNIVITQTTADGHVVTWYDQSGNGNDATQATAANQPKIVSAGSLITQGSKTSIDFGTIAENKSLEASTSSTTNNFISVVHNVTYRSSKNQVLLALSNNNYIILASGDSGKLKYANSNDNLISTTNIGSFQLSTIDINNGKLYTNGSEEDSVVAVSGETSRYIIGNYTSISKNELEGYVSEIIVFGSAQSSNRTAIEQNINDYYNIYP